MWYYYKDSLHLLFVQIWQTSTFAPTLHAISMMQANNFVPICLVGKFEVFLRI